MKKILTLIAAAALLVSCGALRETPEEKAQHIQDVREAVLSGRYSIDVTTMIPLRGTTKHVSNYSLTVKDGRLYSYLPYIGAARMLPYGGGKGLNFTAPVGSYQESMGKNGMRIIEVGTQNEEDRFLYRIEVFDNGRSTIDVLSQNRETISFSGEMTFD
jgi:hypothetical protein